jgi:hypothetical protein
MKAGRICVVSVAVLFFSLTAARAQENTDAKFDGDWRGTIAISGDEDEETRNIKIRITIKGASATQYFFGEDGWEPVEPAKISVTILRNNCVVMWLNEGGVWSETQTFSLSFRNAGELHLVWVRHVNNIQEGQDNDIWFLAGEGVLSRIN